MAYDWGKIGGRIKSERKARGMSMDELASELGTTRQSISKWEKGESVEITLNMLLSLCNVFECELGYLLCEFDNKTRDEVDICEKTGLSPEAVQNLLKLYNTSSVLMCGVEYDDSKREIFVFDEGQIGEYAVLRFVDDLLRNATVEQRERRRAWVSLTTFAEKYQEYKKGRLKNEISNLKTAPFHRVNTRMEREAFFLQKYMLDFVEEIVDLYVATDSKGTRERKKMEKEINGL